MTSGTIIRDLRVPPGAGQKGAYYYKTWNGQDWPALPKPVRPVVSSPVESYTKLSKRGRLIIDRQMALNNRHVIEAYKREMRAYSSRKVRRERERRDQPHGYSWQVIKSFDSLITTRWPDGYGGFYTYKATWSQTFGGGTISNPAWTSEDSYALIEKLKVRLVGSEFNFGVFLGTSHQALNLITNSAVRLAAALDAARHGKWGKAEKALRGYKAQKKDVSSFYKRGRTTSQNWLELSYGWKPLVSDLQAGAEMVAHMTGQPYTHKVKVRRKLVGTPSSGSPTNTEARGGGYRYGQLIAYLKEVNVPQLTGLTDFASIAWELLPWSFVADWAIPIGNYLAARGVASSLTGTFVTTLGQVIDVRRLYLRTGSAYSIIAMEDGGLYKNFQHTGTRTVSTTLSVPKPTIKGFSQIPSWQRAANAVALLVQRRAFWVVP